MGREKEEVGVLPSLRDGHAAGQAAAPPPPAPRHTRARGRGTWEGARLGVFEFERAKGTDCSVTGEPGVRPPSVQGSFVAQRFPWLLRYPANPCGHGVQFAGGSRWWFSKYHFLPLSSSRSSCGV